MDKAPVLREYTDSKIVIYTGPRGAGKTLRMTAKIEQALMWCININHEYKSLIGSREFQQPLKVWSNLPISITYAPSRRDGAKWPGANKIYKLTTLPLNMHDIITFQPHMRWGFIFIDEVDRYVDRQDWQNNFEKLLMRMFVQVRKVHLSLYATIQSFQWVNPRLSFQVDGIVECKDDANTLWGKANKMGRGIIINEALKDISGVFTGQQYHETGEVINAQFFGKPFHNHYDTDLLQDPWEHYETISIKRRRYEIDLNDPSGTNNEESYKMIDRQMELLYGKEFKKIKRSELNRIMINAGVQLPKPEIMKYIEDVWGGRKYNVNGEVLVDLSEARNIKPQKPLDIPDDLLPPPKKARVKKGSKR